MGSRPQEQKCSCRWKGCEFLQEAVNNRDKSLFSEWSYRRCESADSDLTFSLPRIRVGVISLFPSRTSPSDPPGCLPARVAKTVVPSPYSTKGSGAHCRSPRVAPEQCSAVSRSLSIPLRLIQSPTNSGCRNTEVSVKFGRSRKRSAPCNLGVFPEGTS